MDTPKAPSKSIIAIIVVVLLVITAGAVMALSNNDPATEIRDTTTTKTNTKDSSGGGTNNATVSTGNYKDGTYNATGSYRTPGGPESIEVKVTLTDGVITDAAVTQNASGGEAEEYQSKFITSYKSEVVGKKINEVSLSRVAGSSLTPLGFNAALETIKSDAQA